MERSEGLMGYQLELMSFLEDVSQCALENQNFIDEIEELDELDEDVGNILLNAYRRQLEYAYKMIKYNKKLFDIRKTLTEL
jgi:hypothetical protein